MKPKIKKGMSTFLGCYPGELRLSYRTNQYSSSIYPELVTAGLIEVVPANEPSEGYTGLALTDKGKSHVAPLESFYARL